MISRKAFANNPHLVVAPCVAIIVYGLLRINSDLPDLAAITAALTLLIAWWWATEALPIPATSLVPFALFPIFGVLDYKAATASLGSHIIFLLMGGFIMAKALERSGAHRNFALLVLHLVGTSSYRRMMAAFMLAAALLSMWVSNTATCIMLTPIVLASLKQIEKPELSAPLIIAVAYACSIGGIATLVGTPPNVIFAGIYEEISQSEFGFLEWAKIGFPIVVLLLPITWLWLGRNLVGGTEVSLPEREAWTTDQKRVVAIFICVVFLWVFRTQPFGGWTTWLGLSGIGDATIAMLGALAMFLVRSEKGDGLLDWQTANQIPWGTLLMFAAGITIARAFFDSGLATEIGYALNSGISGMPIFLIILSICLGVTFFTELNSNVATTTLVLPILAAAASGANIPIELLMIPATISASCAFMLPVATAPNAIAYATNQVPVGTMIREGFALNIIHGIVIASMCYLLLV